MYSLQRRVLISMLGHGLIIRFPCENSQASIDIAPELLVHLSPRTAPGQRRPYITPAELPMKRQIRSIQIDVLWLVWDRGHELCTEPLWTRFAEKALSFAHLEHIVLGQWWYPERSSPKPFCELDSLGITDAAFRPLIEAGKFVYRFAFRTGVVVSEQRKTVSPKGLTDLARRVTRSARAGRGGRGDSELDGRSEEGLDSEREGLQGGCFAFRLGMMLTI